MKKKNPWELADKLNKAAGIKPSAHLKKIRKESIAKDKAFDKEHKKYLKERSARYKKEGIRE